MLLLLLLVQILRSSFSQLSEFKLNVPESVIVQEGLCTEVPCSFSHPSNYNSRILGFWFKKGVNTDKGKLVVTNDPKREVKKEDRGRFHLIGNLFKKNCSLSITDVQKKDGGEYFFRIEHGNVKYNYVHHMVNVFVTDLTQKPDIYIPEILEPGHLVKVICVAPWACSRGIPPNFSWMGAVLSSLVVSKETYYFSELTLTPRPQDHGSDLTCQVTLPGARVNTKRTVHLSIAYPLRNFGISVAWENGSVAILGNRSSLNILEKDSLRLECAADSNPPAILSWSRGNQALSSSLLFSPGILNLELLHVRSEDEGEYTCQAQHSWGTVNASLSLFVQGRNSIFTFSNGILLGAGIMALLALSLILPLVKFLKKKQVEDSNSQNIKGGNYLNQIFEEVPSDHYRKPRLPLPHPDTQEPPEELHYASLNIRKLSP